jgi:pimeloyl-ACP methyl ester carboxylesterase
MTTFALIHGAGDVGWYWHLVEAALGERGHDVVAPDLPCDDDSAGLSEYADTVIEAIVSEPIWSWSPSRSEASQPRSSASGCQ